MVAQVGCTHEFSYLLKSHGGSYTGRVLEIPAVIVEAKNKEEVTKHISEATLHYLHTLKVEHEKALNHQLKPRLHTTENGYVEEIVRFNVTC